MQIKSRLQKERQKIQEENMRLQEQLNHALRVQNKLKQQAVLVNQFQPNLALKPPYSNPALLPSLSPPPANFISSPNSPQVISPTSLQVSPQITSHYNPQIGQPPVNSLSQSITQQNIRQVQSQFLNQLSPQISTQKVAPQMSNQFSSQADPRLDLKVSNRNPQGQVVGTSTKTEPSIAAQIALGEYTSDFLFV